MSHSLAVEILHIQKRLQNAGFTQEQSEAQAEALAEVIELASKRDESQLATKRDIAGVELKIAEVKRDLEVKIAEIEVKLAETKNEILKWVVGLLTAQTAVIISCIKLMH